ncbi:MAG: hypothetical protein R3320_09905, partial [Nitriliruptorales bacterium]|nr:hypothetical protein [Nitriliruptorales bacterium]
LDGLPLALELAAARLAHLSPAEVAARLDDRFRLLAGGRRRTERQQTLRAAIDWSYELLDEDERILLRRLSVFVGGAPLDAVEAVAMEGMRDALTIDLLGRLVTRSLVVADSDGNETRYRLLETIRLYSEEKLLAAGEAEAIRNRHRDWYLEWLDRFPWDLRLISPQVGAAIQKEYDNLRLGLEWSAVQQRPDLLVRLICALAGFGILNGFADELDRWAEVAGAASLPSTLKAELDAHTAYLDTWRYDGDPDSFVPVRERARAAYAALAEDHPYRALAICCFGATHTVTHPKEPWRIGEPAEEAMALAERHDAPWMRVIAVGFLARARLYEGDPQGAADLIRETMAAPTWDTRHDGLFLRHDLAVALHLLGQQVEALEHARSVATSSSAPWRHIGLLDAAIITAAMGDPPHARELIRRAVERLDELHWHHPLAYADCATLLGAIASHEARWEDAARTLAANGQQASHPSIYVLWVHYRDEVRQHLPRDVRRRCVEQGMAMGVDDAIEQELARDRSLHAG